MIKIREFDKVLQDWVEAIDDLGGYHLVVEDGHATRKLGDKKGIRLLAVVPSAQSGGRPGMVVNNNTTMIWVIGKGWTSQTDEAELEQYERTQDIILQLREDMLERQADGCGVFARLEPASITIDPDYNCFGGWNGWVMQVVF